MITLYGVELWSPDPDASVLLADVSEIAQSRSWGRIRNDSDSVSFTLPVAPFEALCAKLSLNPRAILRNNWTEVRVKRGQTYVAAGRVELLQTSLSDLTIEVSAAGFLDMFRKRRTEVDRIFTATETTTIAWTMINESQSLPNGDYGVRLGPIQATVGPLDREYQRAVIRDEMIALTTTPGQTFDFEFTYDKHFNTYQQMGAYRQDVVYKWGQNIRDAKVTEDSTDLVNEIDALGAGSGADAGTEIVIDNTTSQADYRLAQDVLQESSTNNEDGSLTDQANAYIAAWSTPVVLLDITVDGAKLPYVTDYGIGDYIMIDLTGHPWLDQFVGMYRIQAVSCTLSDDNDEPVVLTVSGS